MSGLPDQEVIVEPVEPSVEADPNAVADPEAVVDPDAPVVPAVDEAGEKVDPILAILKGDKPDPKDKLSVDTVPKAAFLKRKHEGREQKREIARLNAALEVALKTPGKAAAADGTSASDVDLTKITPENLDALVEKKLLDKERSLLDEQYVSGLEERISTLAPAMQQRCAEYAKDYPNFAVSLNDPAFVASFEQVPLEVTVQIAESAYAPQLFSVLAGNPKLLKGLAGRDVNATIEFGKLLGKLNSVSKGTDTKPISPLSTQKATTNLKYNPDDAKAVADFRKLAEKTLKEA